MTSDSNRLRLGLLAVLVCVGACSQALQPAQSHCGSDDPRVGYIAELKNRFIHGVSGTARIVDNCTIVIEDFTFDGLGVPPAVVGIKDNDFAHPVVLLDNIFRLGGYHNETLTVPLPEGVTLDDVPRISISCVAGTKLFGNGNFGDGVFHAPGTPQPRR
ncbi:MAG: DM13 domain-containing protein [Phycisphaerae bacterium]|nr:DM13 domain-containing protein [Phycisphaerae bacterium]